MGKFLHHELTGSIVDAYYEVYKSVRFRRGYTVNEMANALAIELMSRDHRVQMRVGIRRYYKDVGIGWGVANMIVDDLVIVIVANVMSLPDIYLERLQTYICKTFPVGLIVNFGSDGPDIHRRDIANRKKDVHQK